MSLTLEPIDANNWRAVADLAPHDDQRRFVYALAARYLLLGILEDTWHNLGAFEDGTAVAHVMYGVDPEDGSQWIGGLLVDAAHQGRGVGRRVVELLIERLREERSAPIRVSYNPGNEASRSLFAGLGFLETGEMADDERVMELA